MICDAQEIDLFRVVEPTSKPKLSESSMKLLSKELSRVSIASPVRFVVQSVAEDLERASLFNVDLIRDLLLDVRSLEEEELGLPQMILAKDKSSLSTSTAYLVHCSEFKEAPPMKGSCLRLLMDDDQQLHLSFPTSFHMWMWVRSLITSWSITDEYDPTSFPLDLMYDRPVVNLMLSNESLHYKCWISSSRPTLITYCPTEEDHVAPPQLQFDLGRVKEMAVSLDSPLAAGFHLKISIQRAVLGRDAASPSLTFSKFYFILKYRHEAVSTSPEAFPNPVFTQKLAIDVTWEDILDEKLGLYIFFFCLPPSFGSRPQLLGEQFLPFKSLLNIPDPTRAITSDFLGNRVESASIALDGSIEHHMKLLEAKNLPFLKGQAPTGEREVYAKCSYFGSSSLILPRRETMKELKSNVVKGGSDMDLSSMSFILHSEDGLYSAQYVRVRFFCKTEELGDVFVPIRDFGTRETERVYELVGYGESIISRRVLPHKSLIRLSIKLRILPSTSASRVDLVTHAVRSNEYNTKWYAECIPRDLLDDESASSEDINGAIEVFHLSPEYSHLALHDSEIESLASLRLDDECALTKFNSRLLQPQSADKDATILLIVYENERRSRQPPYQWGKDYLRPTDPPHYSDKSGLREFLFMQRPPTGFEWSNDWQVDRHDDHTDGDGWSYARNFGRYMYEADVSAEASDEGYCVRRRLQTREAKAVKIDETRLPNKYFERANDEDDDFRERSAGHVSSVLRLCREKKSPRDPIRVPWENVLHGAICSPSILSLVIEVDRYDPSKSGPSNFIPTRVEIFVTNCPAMALLKLIIERKNMMSFRRRIICFIGAGAPIQSPECYETFTGLQDSIKLEPFNRVPKTTRDEADLLRHCRLRIYSAALISSPLLSAYDLGSVAFMIQLQSEFMSIDTVEKGDAMITLAVRMSLLVSTTTEYLSDMALTGWLHRGEVLNSGLLAVVRSFYSKAVDLLSQFLYLPKFTPALRRLSGKLNYLSLISRATRFSVDYTRAFSQIYGLSILPSPCLTSSLNTDQILNSLTRIAMTEIDQRLDEILEVSSSSFDYLR